MIDNPYRQKPITEKSIINRIKIGGCWCVYQGILGDIDKLNISKAKKAELWDLANGENNWDSC